MVEEKGCCRQQHEGIWHEWRITVFLCTFLLVENFLTHILEVKVLPQLTEKQLFCHNLELALSFCNFCCNLETLE